MTKNYMALTLILLGVASIVGASVWLLASQDKVPAAFVNSFSGESTSELLLSPSSSPLAYQELTIPYLRSREYQSQLAQLQPLSQTDRHTTYLTSYQSDGLQINALLTQPSGEPPAGGWPAIVFVHGYIAPSTYRTTERYLDHVNYLAGNEFVVLKIDLRGHGNSEGQPGGAYYSSDYVVDTLNARAALQGSNLVNPDRIGLWGHSMAGNVVIRSLAAQPEIPAVAIWAGAGFSYADLRQFGIDDNSYRPPTDPNRQRQRTQLFAQHGQFDPNSEFWRQVAATNYLGDIQGAIGLYHAVDDDVVSVEYSRNLNQLLEETSIPHEYHEYSSGGHNISGASFNEAMADTVDFFKQNL